MLTINLLPEGARKAGLSQIEQFHRTPIMAIGVVILVAVPLLLWVPVSARSRELQRLTEKMQVLEPQKAQVDQLQRLLTQLRAQEKVFQSLGKGQNLWAQRLNILSDVTPAGVWYTELLLDAEKGLLIQGSAIGEQVGPEMVSVTRLVKELEANPAFASALKDIQIESIKRVPVVDTDVVQFTLACTLQGGAPTP